MRVDQQSETWMLVESFIAAERSAAIKQLANPRNDLPATQLHRGILLCVERLEALANEVEGKPDVEIPVDYEVGGI